MKVRYEDLLHMTLGDTVTIDEAGEEYVDDSGAGEDHKILRVPGGWIYQFYNFRGDGVLDPAVFVPVPPL